MPPRDSQFFRHRGKRSRCPTRPISPTNRQRGHLVNALYFGRPFDTTEAGKNAFVKIEERHWPTVQELAETLLRDKSLSRAQVLKLMLQASLDAADAAAVAAH